MLSLIGTEWQSIAVAAAIVTAGCGGSAATGNDASLRADGSAESGSPGGPDAGDDGNGSDAGTRESDVTTPADAVAEGSADATFGPLDASPCVDGGSTVGSGHDANPDGVPYPNPPGGYGHNARAGSTPGSVVANYKFLGYPDPADTSGCLQTISLADYYDPCQKRYKMLHITVAGVWSTPCSVETDALVAGAQSLRSHGIVVLQAIDDGATEGVSATLSDLNYWISVHRPTFGEMLDPGNHNLGPFFNSSGIPWNADVDVRTMELLTSAIGAEAPADIVANLPLVSQSPGYPIPAGLCP
jgi:hypothetical protein